ICRKLVLPFLNTKDTTVTKEKHISRFVSAFVYFVSVVFKLFPSDHQILSPPPRWWQRSHRVCVRWRRSQLRTVTGPDKPHFRASFGKILRNGPCPLFWLYPSRWAGSR